MIIILRKGSNSRDPVAAPRKAIGGRPLERVKAPIEEIEHLLMSQLERMTSISKVVDVVKSDSFNGVHFQYYNHKSFPAQPTKMQWSKLHVQSFHLGKRKDLTSFAFGTLKIDIFKVLVLGRGDLKVKNYFFKIN